MNFDNDPNFKGQPSQGKYTPPQAETNRYSQMFHSNRAVQLLINPDSGLIVDANQAALDFYGYTLDQIKSVHIQDFNTLTADQVYAEMQRARKQERTFFEFRHRLASGEIRDVDVFSSPIDTPDGTFLYSIIFDVTGKRESEVRYRSLFEQTNDAVFILDLDGNHTHANQRAADLFGYNLEELLRLSLKEMVVPDEHQASQQILTRLLAGEHIAPYERTFRHKDGTLIPTEINVEIVRDKEGNFLHIQSIVRDITERKRMEQINQAFTDDIKALQEIHLELSEIPDLDSLYYRMIELTHKRLNMGRIALFLLDVSGENLLGTYGTDRNGNIRDEHYYHAAIHDNHWTHQIVNAPNHTKIWLDDLLYDDEEILGTGWKAASTLWNGSRSIGYLMCDNYISGRPPRTYESELLSLLGSTFGHLIERKQAEEALRQSEERYRSVVATMAEGVVLEAADGSVITCNPAAEKILGLTLQQLQGKAPIDPNWYTIQEDGTRYNESLYSIRQTLRTGQPISDAVMGIHKPDDSVTWISTNSQPMIGADQDKPYAALVTFSDITAQKQAQQRKFELALEKERMQLLTTFIQNSAHEFRTPLSTISANVYLMLKTQEPDLLERRSERILFQVNQISNLVDMLLTIARLEGMERLSLLPIDMSVLVASVCQTMRVKKGDHPKLNYTPVTGLPPVLGDTTYLGEAIEKLLDNAYSFTPPEGTINVTCGVSDDQIWIDIEDNGSGIDEADIPFIFDTFWRHDSAHSTPGFGLGLSIAKKIIERHGGHITVESTVAVGSCFRLSLPIAG